MAEKRAHNLANLVGLKFNRLLVIKRTRNDKHRKARWICKCDCGNETTAGTTELRKGSVSSCGCLRREQAAINARNRKPKPKRDWTNRQTKYCPQCKKELSAEEFGKNKSAYDGLQAYCKKHHYEIVKENRVKNWGSLKEYRLRYRHGISMEQYEQMLEEQKHLCAICQKYPAKNLKNPWHVDHDHATGKVRGILCHSCNTALGNFNDDPEILQRALDYLQGENWTWKPIRNS